MDWTSIILDFSLAPWRKEGYDTSEEDDDGEDDDDACTIASSIGIGRKVFSMLKNYSHIKHIRISFLERFGNCYFLRTKAFKLIVLIFHL